MSDIGILVVEDNPLQRQQVMRLLQDEGYSVFQASTGHETIRILESQRVSLVLTDRKMPWMGGDWLLSYVRENYPSIPVVFITAYPEEIEELKPDGLLVKPFSESQLTSLVQDMLERQKS